MTDPIPSPIIHTRIDDRLIHGQVATMWTNQLGATRIMVVDDKASADQVLKMSLRMATPTGVALSVLDVERATERILGGAYAGQRVFLIVKSPRTLTALVQQGVPVTKVNVGNLTFSAGKTKVASTVAVSTEDIEAFTELAELGVKLTLQLIPNNPIDDFMAALHSATGRR
jgi:mannose PTS system EIIAB component